MIKGPVFQEDITTLNVYGTNKRESIYIGQKPIELKGKIVHHYYRRL